MMCTIKTHAQTNVYSLSEHTRWVVGSFPWKFGLEGYRKNADGYYILAESLKLHGRGSIKQDNRLYRGEHRPDWFFGAATSACRSRLFDRNSCGSLLVAESDFLQITHKQKSNPNRCASNE